MPLGRRLRRIPGALLPVLAVVWASAPVHGCYLLVGSGPADLQAAHCAQVTAQFDFELDAASELRAESALDADSSDSANPNATMPRKDLGSSAPAARPVLLAEVPPTPSPGRALLLVKSVLLIQPQPCRAPVDPAVAHLPQTAREEVR